MLCNSPRSLPGSSDTEMSCDAGPFGPTDPRITGTPAGRPNHGLIGFVVLRCPTFLLGNPLLMAPQESVGGLGCPLDQISCRRPLLRCSLIHPHRQSCHHLYRRQNPRPKRNPLHVYDLQYYSTELWTVYGLRRLKPTIIGRGEDEVHGQYRVG